MPLTRSSSGRVHHYAIGAAVDALVRAILRDQRTVVTVSSLMEGEYGVTDICLSLPTVVRQDRVLSRVRVDLSEQEKEGFLRSAATLKRVAEKLGL